MNKIEICWYFVKIQNKSSYLNTYIYCILHNLINYISFSCVSYCCPGDNITKMLLFLKNLHYRGFMHLIIIFDMLFKISLIVAYNMLTIIFKSPNFSGIYIIKYYFWRNLENWSQMSVLYTYKKMPYNETFKISFKKISL